MLTFLIGLQGVGFGDNWVTVGHIEHEERSSINKLPGNAVDLSGTGLFEHIPRFVAPVVKHTIQHETQHIRGN